MNERVPIRLYFQEQAAGGRSLLTPSLELRSRAWARNINLGITCGIKVNWIFLCEIYYYYNHDSYLISETGSPGPPDGGAEA